MALAEPRICAGTWLLLSVGFVYLGLCSGLCSVWGLCSLSVVAVSPLQCHICGGCVPSAPLGEAHAEKSGQFQEVSRGLQGLSGLFPCVFASWSVLLKLLWLQALERVSLGNNAQNIIHIMSLKMSLKGQPQHLRV